MAETIDFINRKKMQAKELSAAPASSGSVQPAGWFSRFPLLSAVRDRVATRGSL